jgi:hypothetical protein
MGGTLSQAHISSNETGWKRNEVLESWKKGILEQWIDGVLGPNRRKLHDATTPSLVKR